MNQEMDAIYLLSPLPHIVDCLMADFERRRYRRSFVIWTSCEDVPEFALCSTRKRAKHTKSEVDYMLVLQPEQRARLNQSSMAREQIAQLRILNVDFYPRESHLITFRDPWSFPTLFHPACNQLVRRHMDELAQKVHRQGNSQNTV